MERLADFFCDKFSVTLSVDEIKSQAQCLLVSDNGRKCTVRDFVGDSTKRLRKAESVVDETTLGDARLYIRVRDVFMRKLKEISTMRVEDVERTSKVSSDKLDLKVIEALNKAVSESVTVNIPCSIEDIAKILQAVQSAYQEIKRKDKKKNSWVASIEAKVAMLRGKYHYLEDTATIKR